MSLSRRELLRLSPLLTLLFVSCLLATGLFNGKPREGGLLNKPLPPFAVKLTTNSSAVLSPKNFAGQVAVINVFASWCVPCQAEHSALMSLAQSGRVNLYGIAWRDKPSDTARFLSLHGNPFQLVASDEIGQTSVPLALTGVPETLVVDQNGIVVYHHNAPIDETEVRKYIVPLVDKLNKAAGVTKAAPAAEEPNTAKGNRRRQRRNNIVLNPQPDYAPPAPALPPSLATPAPAVPAPSALTPPSDGHAPVLEPQDMPPLVTTTPAPTAAVAPAVPATATIAPPAAPTAPAPQSAAPQPVIAPAAPAANAPSDVPPPLPPAAVPDVQNR